MKKQFLVSFTAVVLIIISCKKESSANEAPVTEAEIPKPVAATAKKYSTDTISSVIEWMGSKPTGSHKGTISLSSGDVFVKSGMVETGKFTLNMKSITVTDPKDGKDKTNLENHLKGFGDKANEDHFFNTKKYPTGSFEITGLTNEADKTIIEGNLTLKGTTKNIKFPAFITVNDSVVTIKSEIFTINRVLWNINYNSKSALENLGNQYIHDEIELKINIAARKD